jgi:nucleoside-diphosphate-sugar epimerase
MSASPIILITGGGGFVGSRFSEIIHLTRFAHARVGVRRWSGAARAARFPVDIVLCDVLDRRQVAEAMKGVNVVVHCAVGGDEVIVDGTRNVLEAATRAGVARVVHVSTAEVYGPDVSGHIDETWPHTPTGNPYADAKIEAERLVWEHDSRGLPVTVFRPSIVYGPWSEQWTAALAQRLQSGRWGRYERYGDGTCNLVYVDDLVAVALKSIDEDKAVGQAFNVGGPDLVTWNEYFDRFNAAMGLPPLEDRSASRTKLGSTFTGAIGGAALAVVARHGDAVMRIYQRGGPVAAGMKRLRRWLRDNPSSSELERLYSRKAFYDSAKAERLLGWRPTIDLDRGLRLSTDWLRYAGLLN